MESEKSHNQATAMVQKKSYPSLKTIAAVIVIIALVVAFITGKTTRFYASFLFLFYDLTGSMWISVVMLGVFQTILMAPLRIVNLLQSTTTADFKQTIVKHEQARQQQFLIKKHARSGNPVLLWYTVSFLLQLVSYITIGRLFLIDFYAVPLNQDMLYSWAPYPDYPIEGLFFKIPYLAARGTRALGFRAIALVWVVIILMQVVFYLIRAYRQSRKIKDETKQSQVVSRALTIASGSTIIMLVLVTILMRNFPTGLEVRLFSGNISIPNRTFNTVTAIATFFTIFWLDLSKIRRKSEWARESQIDEEVIRETQKGQLKDSLRSASLIGMGAYFITNHIPSAFELSIFTFEVISWLSPLTLDRWIKKRAQNTPEKEESTKETEEKMAAEREEEKQLEKSDAA